MNIGVSFWDWPKSGNLSFILSFKLVFIGAT